MTVQNSITYDDDLELSHKNSDIAKGLSAFLGLIIGIIIGAIAALSIVFSGGGLIAPLASLVCSIIIGPILGYLIAAAVTESPQPRRERVAAQQTTIAHNNSYSDMGSSFGVEKKPEETAMQTNSSYQPIFNNPDQEPVIKIEDDIASNTSPSL